MRRLAETVAPLVRETRVLALIAVGAGDHEVFRTVGPTTGDGHDVVDVITASDLLPAPVAASVLAPVLSAHVGTRVAAAVTPLASSPVALVRLALLGVGGRPSRRILPAATLVSSVPVPMKPAHPLGILPRPFSNLGVPAFAVRLVVQVAHFLDVLGVAFSPRLCKSVSAFAIPIPPGIGIGAVADATRPVKAVSTVLAGVEELGSTRLLNAALRTRLERGTIGEHGLTSVAMPPEFTARGGAFVPPFYHLIEAAA